MGDAEGGDRAPPSALAGVEVPEPEEPVEVDVAPVPELVEVATAVLLAGTSWAVTPTTAPVPSTARVVTQRVVRRTRLIALSLRWMSWWFGCSGDT